jgi:hypothetical protein
MAITDDSIYEKLLSEEILVGTVAQDIMTVLVSITMIIILIQLGEDNDKTQILMIGLVGYQMYAYGIYVIEQVYTVYYLAYMAIFSVSLYSLIFSITSLNLEKVEDLSVPNAQRLITLFLLFLIPTIFYPLWISQIILQIQDAERLDYLFSVYIIDLCLIMPAFYIAGYFTLTDKALGLVYGPVLLVLGFAILLPVSLGELLRPLYDQSTDWFGLIFFGILSSVFLIVGISHLKTMKIEKMMSNGQG